ncbi:TonB-dependent receptor plug domain-containing protein [Campylobacter sp. FMV-PI01]|uniref:TonB-dependent receptor plug domain-containing protein n=1 Tax=Campylobacter portucalensis TaxID=2608384 RepID=A0A6L5WHX2_9BACT|nr:TonB-dependent receptor [Campylobacter portucalensis]MSN96848.1 TonB-dependent receptor plug domain-containing protein [Campylobacter portucalensis]
MYKKFTIFLVLTQILQAQDELIFDEFNISATNRPYQGEVLLKNYQQSGSFSYLDGKNISRFRGSSVGDFLSSIPGVFITNKRNSGAITVNIRGLQNENRVPIYIDNGLRSVPSWQGYAGSSTRTYLDPDLISSIEIQKGVNFGGDGVGATGGVVRMQTIGYKDIILDDNDWGVRISGGIMSNTSKKPSLYTRGGYRTKWVDSCKDEDDEECKAYLQKHPQTYNTPARYQNKNPFQNLGQSWNGSIAFAKKWENADIVLAYARKFQGNYFAGKYGSTPQIIGIKTSKAIYDDDYNIKNILEYDPDLAKELEDPSKYKNYNGYLQAVSHEIISKKLVFKQGNYTYYRAKEEVLNTFLESKSYLAKLNLYDEFQNFNLTYSRYDSNFGELMPSQTSIRSDGALQGEGQEVVIDSISSSYRYNPNNPYLDLKFNSYFTKNDTSLFMPFVEDLVDYDKNSILTPLDSRYASFIISNQIGFSLENTSILDIKNKPLKINYGISYTYERFKQPKDTDERLRKKNYPTSTSHIEFLKKRGYDPAKFRVADFKANGKLYERDAKRDEVSAFLWVNYPIFDKFEADFGLRYINAKIKDNNPLQIPNGYDHNKKLKINKIFTPNIKTKALSPAFMMTFKANENVILYAKYAQAVRNPSLFQATKGWGIQNQGEAKHNSLKPERHFDFEIGTNLLYENLANFDNVFGFKFAFYNNYTKDYLTRTNILKSNFQQTTNIKSALFRGLEASIYFDSGKFYSNLGFNRILKTNFCQKSSNLKPGQKQCYNGGIDGSNLSNSVPPKTTLFVNLGTRLLNNKLDLGARYSYYSKRFVSIWNFNDTQKGETNSAQWDPYSIVDLYLDYMPKNNIKFSISLDNLTNRYYLDSNNMGLTPAPGRTLHAGFEYKF